MGEITTYVKRLSGARDAGDRSGFAIASDVASFPGVNRPRMGRAGGLMPDAGSRAGQPLAWLVTTTGMSRSPQLPSPP